MNRLKSDTQLYTFKVFADNFLTKKLNFPYFNISRIIWIWLIFGIIPFGLFAITSLLEHSFYLDGEKNLGMIEDYIFISYFVYIPILLALAITHFPKITGVLHSVREVTLVYTQKIGSKEENDIDSSSPRSLISTKNFNDILKRCEARIQGRGTWRLIYILFVFGGLLWVYIASVAHWDPSTSTAYKEYIADSWSSKDYPFSFWIRTFYELIAFGLIFPSILLKFVAILHSMRAICKELTEAEAIRLRPLSPDRAGGLGALGNYGLKMVTVLIPLLIPLLMYIFFGQLNFILKSGIALYIPLVFFTFVYPLGGAHEAMNKFKKQELSILAKKFNQVYDDFIRDIKTNQLSEIPSDFDLMEKFDKLYSKAEKMPVWPFNFEIVSRFGALVAALGFPLTVSFIDKIDKFFPPPT